MVARFRFGDFFHQLAIARAYIWVLWIGHLVIFYRKHLVDSNFQNINGMAINFKAYPSFWSKTFLFSHFRATFIVCLVETEYLMSGKF